MSADSAVAGLLQIICGVQRTILLNLPLRLAAHERADCFYDDACGADNRCDI